MFSVISQRFIEKSKVNWLSMAVAQPFYRDQLQLSIDSHDARHLMVPMASSLHRIFLKSEEGMQFVFAVGAQDALRASASSEDGS